MANYIKLRIGVHGNDYCEKGMIELNTDKIISLKCVSDISKNYFAWVLLVEGESYLLSSMEYYKLKCFLKMNQKNDMREAQLQQEGSNEPSYQSKDIL